MLAARGESDASVAARAQRRKLEGLAPERRHPLRPTAPTHRWTCRSAVVRTPRDSAGLRASSHRRGRVTVTCRPATRASSVSTDRAARSVDALEGATAP